MPIADFQLPIDGHCELPRAKRRGGEAIPLRPSGSRWRVEQNLVPDQYCVYMMSNRRRTVLYTGVTNDLRRRAWEHRTGAIPGFTKQYHVTELVYYEVVREPLSAIAREKQIKAGSRSRKIALVEAMNPEWRDLFAEL